MSASYCSQVQDGFVPPLAVLVLVLVAELCCGALDELEGFQHGGRVGHVGLTAGETGFCNDARFAVWRFYFTSWRRT